MNWIETVVAGAVVLFSGIVMIGEPAQRVAQDVGSLADAVTFGGIHLSMSDLVLTLGLTALASCAAAAFRFRNWKAALINWMLGVGFGFLFAQLVIIATGLDGVAIFALAPSMALFAAKLARTIIQSDEMVDAAAGAAVRFFKNLGGKK